MVRSSRRGRGRGEVREGSSQRGRGGVASGADPVAGGIRAGEAVDAGDGRAGATVSFLPMRYLALALVLLGCAADPVLPPRDCTPGQTSACACVGGATGVQTCGTGGTLGACVCPDGGSAADVVDASSPVDVVALEDRPAVVDTGAPDVASGVDVVDAGAPDVRDAPAFDVPSCTPQQTACGPLPTDCVRLDIGTGDSPPRNCGACGVTCAPGEGCIDGRCTNPCPRGQLLCEAGGFPVLSGCVDPSIGRVMGGSTLHCGGCNRVTCSEPLRCVGGRCQ